MQNAIEQARKLKIDFTGLNIDVLESANRILASHGLSDVETVEILNIAGEVLRENRLFYQGDCPEADPVEIDGVESCVFVSYRIGVTPNQAADMTAELSLRIAQRVKNIPNGFSVGFFWYGNLMSIFPEDFILIAETLAAERSEAVLRSSVRRAYYGAFHEAAGFHASLETPGRLGEKPAGVHEYLVQRLTNPGIPGDDPRHIRSRQIGTMTRQLRDLRVKADYRIEQDIGRAIVANALAQAKKIITLVNQR